MTNCLFFGDSITYGEYDGVHGGWVDLLKRYCHSKYSEGTNEVNIFNLGIGGETTSRLLKRLEVEFMARVSPDSNVVFMAYGANDIAFVNGLQNVNQETFKSNFEKAISILKSYTDAIYILNILPIANAYDGVETPTKKTRHSADILKYNLIIHKLADENNVNHIDAYSLFFNHKEQLLSNDGVHPNEHGYLLISEIVKPIIEKHL
jgi:lysophospholipase L1-like esterase